MVYLNPTILIIIWNLRGLTLQWKERSCQNESKKQDPQINKI